MLDPEKIRQLIDMMVSNDLVEISLRDGEQEVNLRRPNPEVVTGTPMMMPGMAPAAVPIAPAPAPAVDKGKPDDDLVPIPSPMVGTFYSAPDPDSPPYTQVGQPVHAETVVCIVEAMKVFNEIKAEVDGVIEKILVKNEQAVEYGQPLFLVRPQ